jgi:hypothetical protein
MTMQQTHFFTTMPESMIGYYSEFIFPSKKKEERTERIFA